MQFELFLVIGASLILISIIFAKAVENVGVPTLLLFIGVGIIAGSEGPGGIYFDNFVLTQNIGIISLIFILFAGGLDTDWQKTKKAFYPALILSTGGVIITALTMGLFVRYVLGGSFMLGLLMGTVVSSTDAAAVFSILKMKKISLKGNIKPILELESGSNDPMAVFLTLSIIELILKPDTSIGYIMLIFIQHMSIGTAAGFLFGKLMVFFNKKLKFNFEGIYPVFSLAFCILTYAATAYIGGSGFLAVYLAGIIAGNSHYIQKKSLNRFFDGLAVLSQIVMFLTLGLLVYPSELSGVFSKGLILVGVLMLIARPLSVFISLIPFKYNWKEKIFVSWVGLRGAVPIILATFPLLAGVPGSKEIFNIVFFIVITSVFFQGWSVNAVANLLGLSLPVQPKTQLPLEFNPSEESSTELMELIVPFDSPASGKEIVELRFPPEARIVLIYRDEKSIIPDGRTVLNDGDVLMILGEKIHMSSIKQIFES